jgi:hypothetical protein
METWEYGELIAESVTVSDDGEWVTKFMLTWHGPGGGSRSVSPPTVHGLNRLGGRGWELVGVTRTQLEDQFQIKVVTTYVLKRSVRRRARRDDSYDSQPIAA